MTSPARTSAPADAPQHPARTARQRLLRPLLVPLRWVGRHEAATLVALLVAAAGCWGFVELADEVLEGATSQLDERILLAMRTPGDPSDPVGPGWMEELGRDLTAFGGMGGLTLLTLATLGYLLLQRNGRGAALVAAAIGGGVVASLLLKQGFDRPRPDLVPHGSIVYTTSFPSGHSMLAALTYLTLGTLLAQAQSRLAVKAYLLLCAVVLTVLVGVSRVYLGVHWPSDVLAGWTAGLVWAVAFWGLGRLVGSRARSDEELEREDAQDAGEAPAGGGPALQRSA